jgi:hypothetical protein
VTASDGIQEMEVTLLSYRMAPCCGGGGRSPGW